MSDKLTAAEITDMPIEKLARRLWARLVSRDGEKKIAFNADNVEDEAAMRAVAGRKTEIVTYLEAEAAKKAAAEKAEEEAAFIPYIVNDPTGYGIHNGFFEPHRGVKKIIREAIPHELHSIELRDEIFRFARNDNDIKAAAMPYYTPYPICEDWTEEYKARRAEEIAERKAPGECMVPRDIAAQMMRTAAEKVIRRKAVEVIPALDAEIRVRRRYLCADSDAARAATIRYNEVNNDGGEGYVPPYCTQADITYFENELAAWRKYGGVDGDD